MSDVVAHFGALSDGERSGLSTPGNVVVGGDDPSFASTFVNPHPGSQGLDHHLSLGVISQPGGGGAILGSALSMVRTARVENAFEMAPYSLCSALLLKRACI